MKITIVQGAFFPVPAVIGGAVEKVWDALGKEFSRRGHDVTHVSRQFPGLPPLELSDGVRHVRVPGFDAPASRVRLKMLDLVYSLRVLWRLPPADILVTNTFWLPILVRDHRLGETYVHVARYPKGQMRFYGRAARLQTVTRAVADAIESEAPRLRSRVRVIPYPMIENGMCEPLGIRRGEVEKHILFVGRVHPEKGLALLLKAVATIPRENIAGWRLIIVGPAEARYGGGGETFLSHLKKLAEPIADRIDWIGPVFAPAALADIYRRASLFVYPSLAEFGETFGLAPLEAMSHGCPPLVSDLHCFRDYLHDGVNGFVFNHRAADATTRLARRIEECIGDPQGLRRTGQSALATAQGYTVSHVGDAFLRDFESLLQENSAHHS